MKKIGFIGAYDKTDFILYVAKILVEMGKKVILVDGTITQKSKYVVPVIKPSKTYVTEFEGIDIAVGCEDFENIKKYLAIPLNMELDYDVALIDMDTTDSVERYNIENFDQVFFATSFDMYSIKKGIESISGIQNKINVTKIIFAKEILKEDDDYLNFLSVGSKIEWNPEIIYFPFELGDQSIIYSNQRVSKIKFRKLSTQYKEGLMYVASKIIDESEDMILRKTFKKIEKGV